MAKMILAIILLALLIVGTLWNVHVLDRFVHELEGYLDASQACADSGDYQQAVSLLWEAIRRWEDSDDYTHIFIRHSEVDSTTDAFYELLSDLSAGDGRAAVGSYGKIRAHLRSLASIEHIKFGSVF